MRDIEIPFEHRQAAHCESGAIGSLLRHAGLDISEPMAFGIGGGLSYAWLPFIKFGGQPLLAYRMPPGHIIRTLTRRLGVRLRVARFKEPEQGMAALDDELAAGRAVGIQGSAYWLTYFPPDMRFHFNVHNMVVYGRQGDNYLISDPVIDIRVECEADALRKARFARGVMAPRGKLYYPLDVSPDIDLRGPASKAIRFTAGMMIHTPAPVIGIRGMRRVARRIERLDPRAERANKLLLGHIVRMQEEIGTGGAGFRYLYASFLQESARLLDKPALGDIARDLTAVGDDWRQFALDAARMCKGRMDLDYAHLAAHVRACAEAEAGLYRRLRGALR